MNNFGRSMNERESRLVSLNQVRIYFSGWKSGLVFCHTRTQSSLIAVYAGKGASEGWRKSDFAFFFQPSLDAPRTS